MIIKLFVSALIGRRFWLKIKKKYNIVKNGYYVIVLPDNNCKLNMIALRHINDFLQYRKGCSAIILSLDDWVINNYHLYTENAVATIKLDKKKCQHLVDYYYYYNKCNFSERFILVSLQDTHGKKFASVEHINGIEKEDMVCIGLYVIKNWVPSGVING